MEVLVTRARGAATLAATFAILLVGCGVDATTAGADVSEDSGAGQDAGGTAGDADGAGDAARLDTDASGPLVIDDLPALKLLIAARAGAEAAAKTAWPSAPQAVWPGFSLHKVPTLLVILSSKGMPIRAYLLGATTPPTGATAFDVGGVSCLRYDAGAAGMGPGETVIPDQLVAAKSTLVVTWSAVRDTDSTAWIETLGGGYMTRLREVEAQWLPVQACGQSLYPRFELAIALVQLEAAVLTDALNAQTPAAIQSALHEWAAARAAGIAVTNFVGQRARHYDNLFGSTQFVAGRLSVASGQRTAAGWLTTLKTQLAEPAKIPIADFDALLLDSGILSAAAIEAASRAGWDVEPAFHAGNNVRTVVVAKLGEAPAQALAAAKAKHDWAGFVARAKLIMALPVGAQP